MPENFGKFQSQGGYVEDRLSGPDATGSAGSSRAPEPKETLTQTILRLYEAREHALLAARELLKGGFASEQIVLVVTREGEPAEMSDSMRNEVARMGVHEDDAPHYAESLRRGGSMVKVDAPHHRAAEATRILDDHGPVASPGDAGGSRYMTDREAMRSLSRGSGPEAEHDAKSRRESGDDDPAPLSHALHMPTLSDDPAPLSHFLHIPVLSED